MADVVATDPFKDERRSGFERLSAQGSPLGSVHLRPGLLLQVIVEVLPQDGRQRRERHAVGASVALVTPEASQQARFRLKQREREKSIGYPVKNPV